MLTQGEVGYVKAAGWLKILESAKLRNSEYSCGLNKTRFHYFNHLQKFSVEHRKLRRTLMPSLANTPSALDLAHFLSACRTRQFCCGVNSMCESIPHRTSQFRLFYKFSEILKTFWYYAFALGIVHSHVVSTTVVGGVLCQLSNSVRVRC